MKIIHLISGGDSGGAKTHVLTLLDELRKLNIEVELVCIMDSIFTEEAREAGLKVTVFKQAKRWDVSVISKIKDYINASGCDLVHCHGARANYIALFIMNSVKVPMITTLHSDYKLDFKDNLRKQLLYTPINSFALRRFKHILCVTRSFKNMLVSRGFKKERLEVIYNGIDYDKPLPTLEKDEFFKAVGTEYDESKVYIGIAARLFEVKGVDVFLKAAAKAAQDPNICFLVLGDGDMRSECERIIEENGLIGRVHMAGQISDETVMNSYYKYIDINCLTSHSESFPYALLEGAYFGCATIATAVGGIPEMITNGVEGLLAKDGDTEEIAEYMLTLANDRLLRQKYGDAFHKKARMCFSSASMAKTHADIYNKLITAQSPSEE